MSDAMSMPMNFDDDTTTPGGGAQPVRWVTVARTMGVMQASIMAGRLQAENIPARAWQEGAGSALGLTVGILGTGHVDVPEEYVEAAEAILALEFADEDGGADDGESVSADPERDDPGDDSADAE